LRKALDSIPSTTRGKDGVILINQGWFNIRKYRAGGMAQVVENLPSKLKALRWLTPTNSRGREQENHGSKPAWANGSRDPVLKTIHHKKRTGGVSQGVSPEFKLQYHKKTKQLYITLQKGII
jgi:hypothetical protein